MDAIYGSGNADQYHLLALRENITPFDVDLVTTQKALDFSHSRTMLGALGARRRSVGAAHAVDITKRLSCTLDGTANTRDDPRSAPGRAGAGGGVFSMVALFPLSEKGTTGSQAMIAAPLRTVAPFMPSAMPACRSAAMRNVVRRSFPLASLLISISLGDATLGTCFPEVAMV